MRGGTLARHQIASQALREWRAQVRSLDLPCFDADRVEYEHAVAAALDRLRALTRFDELLDDYLARRREQSASIGLADAVIDGTAYWRRTRELIAARAADWAR